MNAKKLLKQAQFHGLNKLDDAKCRCVWITALLLLLAASGCVAANLIFRFLDAPTYIVRKEKIKEIMEFPSVQLCPEVSYPGYKIEEFLSQITFPDNINKSYIRGIIQQLGAFYSPDVMYTLRDVKNIQAVLDHNKLDVYSAAKMLTVSCEETLMKCRLFGQMENCTKLFRLEISQYGFCCIFNSRSLRHELLNYGVHKVKPTVEYLTPFHGFQGGGLFVAVNQSKELNNVDLDYIWMSVDGGQAYVDATLNGTALSPGMEMWFGHYNEGFHIDEYAVTLTPELRGCRLVNEPLTLFPIHRRKYCLIECEVWHVMKTCKCVLITHPVPPNMTICRARSLPCARHAIAKFNKGACPCLNTCDADTDHVVISTFQLYQHTPFIDPFYADLDLSKTSIVRVFIARRSVKIKSRRTFYSREDLFGQLGGIFNVFFGCSLLSILEIIQIIKYAFANWRQRKKNQSKYLKTKNQGERKTRNKKVTFENVVNK